MGVGTRVAQRGRAAIIPSMAKSKNMTDQRSAVVAIDGPVASGKSSVGRAAATELGLRFLDTGIMYRAVTWLALHRGVAVSDSEAVGALAGDCKITLGNHHQRSDHASTDHASTDHASTEGDPSVVSDIVIDGHTPGPRTVVHRRRRQRVRRVGSPSRATGAGSLAASHRRRRRNYHGGPGYRLGGAARRGREAVH